MRRSIVGIVRPLAVVHAEARRRFHGQTVQKTLVDVRERLHLEGITGSDAKALLACALEPKLSSSNELFFHMDRPLQDDEAHALERMVRRREKGEPLAYVVGMKEFWSMEFSVTKDTLIPRADSECLIECLAEMYPKSSRLRILDIGTGSGALLLSALSEYPCASGVGIDISTRALQVAAANAERLGLGDRSKFIHFDMEMLPSIDTPFVANDSHTVSSPGTQFRQQFDVVLCNPPYIPLSEVPLIAPDVLAHEPHGALFSAGPDALTSQNLENGNEADQDHGLRFYVALRNSVDKLLDAKSSQPCAVLAEIGSERQALAVRDLFEGATTVEFAGFLKDAGNRHRGVVFRSGECSRHL